MEIINHKFEKSNFLPFLWIYGKESKEEIIRTVDAIHKTGAKTLCIEPKRHPYFGEKPFFDDMRYVIERCKEYDMGVWLLDDYACPTGHAGGILKKLPHLKKEHILETHTDILGDNRDIKLIIRKNKEEDELLCACAYKRVSGSSQELTGEPIDLTSCAHGRYLYCNLPEGDWRIFFIFRSMAYCDNACSDLVDFMREESCRLQIDYVYEPLYKEFKEDFGKTFLGFFIDEPMFDNPKYKVTYRNIHPYFNTVGMEYVCLPFTDKVVDVLKSKVEGFTLPELTLLWHDLEGRAPYVRHAYMEYVSDCYRDNYVKPNAQWSHDHGVEYIGHIVEDYGVHARLDSGVGHFFKAMEYQDMSGIDIVLNQVIPGFAHYSQAGTQVLVDTDFFHYVLRQLGASSAHIDPKKRGRAMCEMFGAYGWNLDVTHQKWLMDYLMVCGINRFVAHSFTDKKGDLHFPPHFYDGGLNPQFNGYCANMAYCQRVLDKLEGGVHVAPVAMLYDGEGEWMNGDDHMPMQTVARPLIDNFYNYDIIPMDTLLSSCTVEDGKLVCNEEKYSCFIVPKAFYLPDALVKRLGELSKDGLKIIFVERRTKGCDFGEVVALGELTSYLDKMEIRDIEVKCSTELLRYYHEKEGEKDKFFFTNEDVVRSAKTEIKLDYKGKVKICDLMAEEEIVKEIDGKLSFEIAPYNSLYIETMAEGDITPEYEEEEIEIKHDFDIYLAPCEDHNAFEFYMHADKPFNIIGFDAKPDFSGVVRFDGEIECEKLADKVILDLGRVGGVAEITLNGRCYDTRTCNPFKVDVTDSIKLGKNALSVKVAGAPTALYVEEADPRWRSSYIPGRPVGLLGGAKLVLKNKK